MNDDKKLDGPNISRYESRPGYAERKPKEIADATHDETDLNESSGVDGTQSDD